MKIQVKCPVCGYLEQPSLWRLHDPAVLYDDWCYCCSWWQVWMIRKDFPNVIRYREMHYTLNDEFETERRGYAPGTTWTVEFNDGRVFESTNVQCQGPIPPRFLPFLPDNARRFAQIDPEEIVILEAITPALEAFLEQGSLF